MRGTEHYYTPLASGGQDLAIHGVSGPLIGTLGYAGTPNAPPSSGRRSRVPDDPAKADSPKRILYVVESMWGCAWYRCHVPATALIRRGHEAVLTERLSSELLEQCDVVVFQRPSRPSAAQAISWAREHGKLAVVDMDDDMWSIHPTNPAWQGWNETPALQVLGECVRTADLVTVASEDLRGTALPMNRRVVVLPNMLPEEHWPGERHRSLDAETLVIGWAGSPSHGPDLELLSGTVETLLAAYPNVEFVTVGLPHVPFRPHPRLKTADTVMIEEYHTVIEQFDIGVIPLVDSRFNRCKSDLKFLEYSIVGIPSVASKVVSYEGSVKHGENGFLARNAKDWLKYLSRLIEDAELRDRIGERARAFAETRIIDRSIGLWERAYGIVDTS